MSLAFGWTPREIGALTLSELAIYLEPRHDAATQWFNAEEARRRVWERSKQRENWVRDIWEVIDHGLSAT
ncbi:MAG: hypothetical protein SGJ19_13380 [Planctomycetia bacterium]|nr:hypothetical protein [Planctomycetia bacterium]